MAQVGHLIRDIGELVTLQGVAEKDGRHPKEHELKIIPKAAMVIEGGRISWLGSEKKLSAKWARTQFKETYVEGRPILPGFVECHTHLVFAGDRMHELDLLSQGMTYQEIAARGGGIRSTVKATRNATFNRLLELGQERVLRFTRQGVTTLEVKSGYGLDLKNEEKILNVIRSLKGPRVVATFLGPHAIPEEQASSESYIQELIEVFLPRLHRKKLFDRVDIFIEKGYFTPEQGERWLNAAQNLNVPFCAHVEQLHHTGGVMAAVKLGASSVEHVVQATEQDRAVLAQSSTVAVCLPTADLYLKMAYPKARQMIDEGVRVALATDFNPGSSPTQDLSLVGVLARVEMGMSLAEVLAAYTYNAARALGLEGQLGSLDLGKVADFVVLNEDWRGLFHSVGYHPVHQTWVSGKKLKTS